MISLRYVAALSLLIAVVACTEKNSVANAPWRTVADSTGDTIRISITGPMPASTIHGLVAELSVGAEDGAEEELFGSISDVVPTDDGGLLVWDSQAKAIRRFAADGTFLRRLGANGGGPGEHGHVNGIVRLANGGWAVWDANGSRINRYREDGTFVDIVRAPVSGWYLTDGLRTDSAGSLYVWSALKRDSTTANVTEAGYLVVSDSGAVVDTVPFPMFGPEPDALSAQSPDGGSMINWGRPWAPANEAAMGTNGNLVAGIGTQYVFYILPRTGKPVRVEREYEPVPVGNVERRDSEAMINERLRRVNPSWSWTGAPIPDMKPPYRDFKVGADGSIWVRLYSPAEPIPEAEMAPVNPERPNAVRPTTREPELYDVYDASGNLLGRVTVPSRAQLLRVSTTHAWGVLRDSLDVNYAVRFRIEPALGSFRDPVLNP